MRVTGIHNKRTIHILIYNGSTHNFLDETVAIKLGCSLMNTKPLLVSVANGGTSMTKAECKGFSWKLQNTSFTTDFMVLSLGFCDIVLGVQWLKTLGPIIWDFQTLSMEFTYEGRRHVLKGPTQSSIKVVKGKSLTKALKNNPQLSILQQ